MRKCPYCNVNVKNSLPMLKNEFKIDFKSVIFLLDYYKIKKRNKNELLIYLKNFINENT